MSKRRLENEVDDLSGDVLSGLDPDQRLRLLLEARVDENEQWIDRLIGTCPRYDYKGTDRAFTDRARLARQIACHAVYDLHTTYLHYEFTRQQQYYTWLLDHERDEEPSDEELERASERADELRELFAELYTGYHAHRRFATEVIGVDPETWLALHPRGTTVFKVVTEVLGDQRAIKLAEWWLNKEDGEELATETAGPDGAVPDDDHQITLEDVTEVRYDGLATAWKETIAEFP